ncbi:MAG: hypothetical protein NC548_60140 [Lachnospiraceae bacterium]|nr:hypothetical protein [Lachnospiraceae bacterium]
MEKPAGGKKAYCSTAIMSVLILLQLILVLLLQTRIIANSDGIFSYTLANNPYENTFIDGVYEEFPKSNGWISAHLLREQYVVEEYDRFNYAGMYHHQRYDVHPPLYYFLVHTISSLFAGQYSIFFTLSINLGALLIVDLLLVQLFRELYGEDGYGIVPFIFLSLLNVMIFLFTLSRMYMLLFMFCCWYLCIQWKLVRNRSCWKRSYLIQMIVCIFGGTLTHYYFYVYAACLTLIVMVFLMYEKRKYAVLNYIYAGVTGIMLSWIFFPWVLAHIFGNAQGKHKNIEPWSLEKIRGYVTFCNENLFNGRIWIAVIILALLYFGRYCFKEKRIGHKERDGRSSLSANRIFKWMVFGSGILYSLIIYTLDGGASHYSTPFYMSFVVWFSMVLIDLLRNNIYLKKDIYIIMTAVICAVVICSGLPVKQYVVNAVDVVRREINNAPLKIPFYRVAEEHRQYDCIFIERKQNQLLDNLWFEFGEYDEFKKIPLADFERDGIDNETLEGRESRDGVFVYAPMECFFDERDYYLVAENGIYCIYEIINEAE